MSEQKVNFDKDYWPKSGTVISRDIPHDLNDLWSDFGDQASVFVAEALINYSPVVYLEGSVVEVFLWSAGGDTLTVEVPLLDLINKSDDYDKIRSKDQRDDVCARLDKLCEVEAAIAAKKLRLQQLLDADDETAKAP